MSRSSTSPGSSSEGGERGGKTRVAIIGTGLAGLHSAHLLSETAELRSRFDVHLFEKSDKLGLDGSSITVDGVRIDVPLRSFNAGECRFRSRQQKRTIN